MLNGLKSSVIHGAEACLIDEYLTDLDIRKAATRAGLSLKECFLRAKYYVYLLVDGRTGEIFYVGKGSGRRFAHHIRDWKNGRCRNKKKHRRIGEIIAAGGAVTSYFLASDLDERAAFRLEWQTIQTIGLERLTNGGAGCQDKADRDIAWATAMLRKLKSFDEWRAGRDLPPWYEVLYFKVRYHLCYMASGQYAEDFRKHPDTLEYS